MHIKNTVLHHSTPLYATLRHSTPLYASVHHSTPLCTTLRHSTPVYASMYTTLRFYIPLYASVRQSTPLCTTLHHSTPLYTTLHHSAQRHVTIISICLWSISKVSEIIRHSKDYRSYHFHYSTLSLFHHVCILFTFSSIHKNSSSHSSASHKLFLSNSFHYYLPI